MLLESVAAAFDVNSDIEVDFESNEDSLEFLDRLFKIILGELNPLELMRGGNLLHDLGLDLLGSHATSLHRLKFLLGRLDNFGVRVLDLNLTH